MERMIRPPLRHGVPCVDGEIEDRRIELDAVRAYPGRLLRQAQTALDRFRQRPVDDRGHLAHDRFDVQCLHAQRCLPGQSQQFLRQAGAAVRRAQRFVDEVGFVLSRRTLETVPEQIEIAGDHAQQIVEVVGDAAREATERVDAVRVCDRVARAFEFDLPGFECVRQS